MSRVHLIWFAELSGIGDPEVHVRVAERRRVIEGSTGVDVIARALAAASDVLAQDGLELTLKIRTYGIHVAIVGGTWEGGPFQARLVQAIGFAERVAAALATTYRARDPASPSLAVIDDAVVEIGRAHV